MSFRLLGMPQRKNSAVTKKNGRKFPAGTSGVRLEWSGFETDATGVIFNRVSLKQLENCSTLFIECVYTLANRSAAP
jgi:hypothetical protein